PTQGNPDGVVFRRLCEWLHDGSYRVRRAAAGALRRLDDPRAVPHLRARADIEAEPQVLAALERALNAFS
ncbi:MAG: HEAT repeat domain-containing protein, partial [Planctomycetota bacterium]